MGEPAVPAATSIATMAFAAASAITNVCVHAVAPVLTYLPDSFNTTVRIARHDPQTGQVVIGPVVMTFGQYSDTNAVWAFGPGLLWVYDVESSFGPVVIAVSSSTGEVVSVAATPKLYRPLLAADAYGLWLGNSVAGSSGPDALYHVAPGARSATDVLLGNTHPWLC